MRILIALFLLFTTTATADDGGLLPGLLSALLMVPVTISASELSLDGFVVRPDRPGRFPLVIMVHGTPGTDGDEFFRDIAKRSPIAFNKAPLPSLSEAMRQSQSCAAGSADPVEFILRTCRRPANTSRVCAFPPRM